MELGEWIRGWIIENLDNRGSDNRGSTVPPTTSGFPEQKPSFTLFLHYDRTIKVFITKHNSFKTSTKLPLIFAVFTN